MGIQGLISLLKGDETGAIQQGHISSFSGKTAAVDAHSWLHKSIYTCAHDLFMGKPTNKYVEFCLKQIKLLQSFKVQPVLVFDGNKMPLKVVNEKRKADREKAKKDAKNLIAMGQMNQAFNQIAQSIDITFEMVSNVIKAARDIGVESIVAPYEADPQMVYLEQTGIVDLIISEDSDLIVFGAQNVFFKLSNSGQGEVYCKDKLENCLQSNKKVRCNNFKFEKFQVAAILSGCDYLKNVAGVGLIKAWRFINMTENENVRHFLKKIPSYLKINAIITDDYVDNFIFAQMAFKHQIVFDPRTKVRVPLNPIEEITDDYKNFLQKFISCDHDYFLLALGNIDTKGQVFDEYSPPLTSYLYSGCKYENENNTAESPVIGFKYDGTYKRKAKSECYDDSQRNTQSTDDDIVNYYKNLDTTPIKKEVIQESPKKKVRKLCKFFKESRPECTEPLRSRFFEPTKENINLPQDEAIAIQKERSPEPEVISVEDEDNDVLKAFSDVGVEIGPSDEENDISPIEEKKLSPRIALKQTENINVEKNFTQNRRNQNVNRLKRVKSNPKIIKNQPSILGFFKKL